MASQSESLLTTQMRNRRWRLNHLYRVIDKNGRNVPFRLNWAQSELLDGLHNMNCILKARQLGFSTFISLYALDTALFNSHVHCGTIAHSLDAARVFLKDKIRFAYDQLPEVLRAARPIARDSADEIIFDNGSTIRVGVSMRSATLNVLHISELGAVCAKFPERAREIRTGALNTLASGQTVFLESTAAGQEGDFFDICEAAQSKQRLGTKLTPLEWRFFFLPWWRASEYEIDPTDVAVGADYQRYFDRLETTEGITLSPRKRAWYALKAATQLADMKREFPSTAAEAFATSVEGSYYAEQLATAELGGRIGEFAADPDQPVHSAWDLGVGDATAIWFWQRLPGRIRLLGYYENVGEGVGHYAGYLKKLYAANGWSRKGAVDWMPHDIKVRSWSTGRTRVEEAFATGLNPRIAPELSVEDGINGVRLLLPICEFDQAACQQGLMMLRQYRREWNEDKGCWRDRPRHDFASHGADAFRYLCCAYNELKPPAPPKPKPKTRTDSRGVMTWTVDEWLRLTGNSNDIRIKV